MTYSNTAIESSQPNAPASISFHELWTAMTAVFRYAPEDRFTQAQEAADQLEAVQNMPTLEQLQGLNRAELVEATRGTRKFEFWV